MATHLVSDFAYQPDRLGQTVLVTETLVLPAGTVAVSSTATMTPTGTASSTATATASATHSPTPGDTTTDSPTVAATATDSPTPSDTTTSTATTPPNGSITDTSTPGGDTATATPTSTSSPTVVATDTGTPSRTATATPDNTTTAAPTGTDTPLATGTETPSAATVSPTDTSLPSGIWSRTISYQYDGLQRLTGATESPGNSFAYSYDLAGNRTGVSVNGVTTTSTSYDAADQVQGWSYDQAGNLTNDGTTSYRYDALNHLTTTTGGTQTSSYRYNGDGTLVGQTTNGAGTSYTQDLAAGQSQILVATTSLTSTDYLYGTDTAPFVALTGGTRTWYGTDGQGSVRQTLDDSATVLGTQSYDPFGQPETGSTLVSSFGYTGELQNSSTGAEYLRARWYQPGTGQLLGVDPLLASTGQPYSYANDNPMNGSDPSGQCTFPNGQLPGVDGSGPCDPAIQGSLTGSSSTVAGGVLGNQSTFIAVLNRELAHAAAAARAGQSGYEAQVLNGCSGYSCKYDTATAGSIASQVPSQVSSRNQILSGKSASGISAITSVFLGTVTGTSSTVSVTVLILNGVVTLAVAVNAPGTQASSQTTTCATGAILATGGLAIAVDAEEGGGIGSLGGPYGTAIGAAVGAIIGLGILAARIVGSLTDTSDGGSPSVYFHGTDIVSANRLLAGEKLSSAIAAAGKMDGPPGFYLATRYDDAEYFAYRRQPGGVLQYSLSQSARAALIGTGAYQKPIPPGKSIRFAGEELVIPPSAFDVFNALRASGEIVVSPARP